MYGGICGHLKRTTTFNFLCTYYLHQNAYNYIINRSTFFLATVRRNEELISNDRDARTQMESSLRASNDLVTQLMDRLKRTEDKLQDEHSAVVALANHSKNIEQSVIGSQQELLSRREVQSNRCVCKRRGGLEREL